jgi:two-component system, OmpR family, response regulator ResD
MTRVLIADDDIVVRDVVRRYLERDGLDVSIAHNGTEALRLLGSERIDVAVLDVMMPGPDGLTLCRSLRQRGGYGVPVILLTALGEEDDRIAGLEAGADDYLTKPFAFAELLIRVKALLRRGPVSRSSVLRVGDLEIDRLTQHVKRAGKTIELTPKEYGLLEYLATHPGRVFSRTMIIEHVWDQSFEGLTNIVDVYVRHLRSKVDDPFPTKLIKTVRGVGYGLVESAAEA